MEDNGFPEPVEWVSPRNLMARGGADDLGVEPGDKFDVEFKGEEYHVTVVSVSPSQSVLQVGHTDLPRNNPDSLLGRLRRLIFR